MYYLKFLFAIIFFNFILSIIFYNPNVFFIVLIAIVGYVAYRNYQISKRRDHFFHDMNQQYTNQEDFTQERSNNGDIIDVEYTQKDLSEDNEREKSFK